MGNRWMGKQTLTTIRNYFSGSFIWDIFVNIKESAKLKVPPNIRCFNTPRDQSISIAQALG